MRIDVEEWMKKPAGKRGARLDALISFKSHRINIEIQRLKRGDEIQRASFYMAKNISEVDEGERLIPMRRHISLWICAFDPFPERALPYYIFSTCYRMHDRIRGIDDRFEIGDGVEYVSINGSCFWDDGPHTQEEEALRDFVADMGKSDPDAIVSESARRVLSEYKEGGRMYDKIELAFKERFKDDYKRAEQEGRESGLKEGEKIGFKKSRDTLVSAMLGKGMSYDLISEISGLTKEQIMAIEK